MAHNFYNGIIAELKENKWIYHEQILLEMRDNFFLSRSQTVTKQGKYN